MSDFVIAVILGIVEGVTEFLPVSSTGHLIVAGHALNFTGERADTFEIFIQAGAILAVVALYLRRFRNLFTFTPGVGGFSGVAGLSKVAIGCVPAFVLGALLHKTIKQHLFSPLTVSFGFIAGAILILLVERFYRAPKVERVDDLTLRQCLAIGCAQCLGLWPGMSRSSSTMLGAMLVGCSRGVAAEYSFLLAVPVLLGAVAFDLYKSWAILSQSDIPLFALGFAVSFLAALAAIRTFIAFLGRHSLDVFAYYRIAFGIVILWILGT